MKTKANFIEVTVNKSKIIFNVNFIIKISTTAVGKTKIILSELESGYEINESYDEIKKMIGA